MLSPDEQLEIWWESLSADRRDAVLHVDPNADPPGWIVASVAAANVFLDESPATGDAEDIKAHLPQLIQDFVAKKQKRGE